MCGVKHIAIQFLPVIGGQVSSQHNFLVLGAIRIAGGDQAIETPLNAAALYVDANKKHYLHQAMLSRVYNRRISGFAYTNRSDNDSQDGVGLYAPPVSGNIYPVELLDYIPYNEYLPEGPYIITDLASTAAVTHLVVAYCMKKPNAE